jgi:hypothetical protein
VPPPADALSSSACSRPVSVPPIPAPVYDHHGGEPGPGRYITIHANAEHAWMTIDGRRYDTVAPAEDGTRWSDSMASTGRLRRAPPGRAIGIGCWRRRARTRAADAGGSSLIRRPQSVTPRRGPFRDAASPRRAASP